MSHGTRLADLSHSISVGIKTSNMYDLQDANDDLHNFLEELDREELDKNEDKEAVVMTHEEFSDIVVALMDAVLEIIAMRYGAERILDRSKR